MKNSLFCCALVSSLMAVAPAGAQPYSKDRPAKRKVVEAVQQRFDKGDAEGAAALLLGVEQACATDCSPEVLSTLLVYLGLAYARLGMLGEAQQAFDKAFAVDPTAAFDSARATDEARRTFYGAAAKAPNARPRSGSFVDLWAAEQAAPAPAPVVGPQPEQASLAAQADPAPPAQSAQPAAVQQPISQSSTGLPQQTDNAVPPAADRGAATDASGRSERRSHVGIGGGGLIVPETTSAGALQIDAFFAYTEKFDFRLRGVYAHVYSYDGPTTSETFVGMLHFTRWFGRVYGLGFGGGFGYASFASEGEGWDGSSGAAAAYATPVTLRFGRRVIFEMAANLGLINFFEFEPRPWGYLSGALQF